MSNSSVDIVLIGGGVMSATLASMLQIVRPSWSIAMYERAESVATESSGEWNNAGTGHAGLCELNYTPPQPDGSVSTTKALAVNAQFQESLGYWSHLVQAGILPEPGAFIRSVPHISYVTGDKDVDFLRARYEALHRDFAYRSMVYSEDRDVLTEWAPLMFQGRSGDAPVAMTRAIAGTDVNFGELTRQLVTSAANSGLDLFTRHEVTDLQKTATGWRVTVKNLTDGTTSQVDTRFVFVGAGGAAILLLQKSGIAEAKGYGGFPVSGQFFRCTNPELIAQHDAKVYGQPQLNAPPMSMPHLDTRVVNGEQVLLFGPFAGFEPRFLKAGSLFDLFKSIKPNNLKTYLSVAKDEFGLTTYLIKQVMLSHTAEMDVLRDFLPEAQDSDWQLHKAGMRVQTLKPGPNGRGKLEFGTEVVTAADGSIAGLLGASPGASTAVSIMLQILERCFPDVDLADSLGDIFTQRLTGAAPSENDRLAHEDVIRDVLGLEGYGSAI
ncbi:MAG: malate dehydrogenase (quinone) [Thermomicrobiales bacterium]|nr:malate dehydrogenase (quinone) [Thermomicrobiales bacterium]